MKQQPHQHQHSTLEDVNTNTNRFKNRNSLPVYSLNGSSTSILTSSCYLCSRNLPTLPSLAMQINDHWYHRECFKCFRCSKFLVENEAHTLAAEHKHLYCGSCYIKRKPLQSTATAIAAASANTTSGNNNLNELKLKFEAVNQKYNNLSNNSTKYSNYSNKILISSDLFTSSTYNNNNNNNNSNTVAQSFSSSSSSSNFSLSPSSSSSWSSSNNNSSSTAQSAHQNNNNIIVHTPPTTTSTITTNNNNNNTTSSQINQRITMLNNLAQRAASSSSFSNETSTGNENNVKTFLKSKRVSNQELTLHSKLTSSNDLNTCDLSTSFIRTTNEVNGSANLIKKIDSNKNDQIALPACSATTAASVDYSFYQSSPAAECTTNNSIINSNNNNNNNNNNNLAVNLIDSNNLIPFKQHSSRCNITLRKLRRGNKRSKSLPCKFNVDSLLDYLNCSMLINKYELKKLNHQRNMLLSSNQSNSSNSSSSHQANVLIYNSKNRYRQLLTYNSMNSNNSNNNHTSSSYYKLISQNQNFSSGYNSENHSSSSTSTSTNNTTAGQQLSSRNILNFYRLSLSHLPMHFLNLQCTCSQLNSTIDLSRLNDALSSSSSLGCFQQSSKQQTVESHLKSPDLDFDDEDEDYDEDDEDDEEEDEDEEEEEDDLNADTSLDENPLNQTATCLKPAIDLAVPITTDSDDIKFQFPTPSIQRAPGTSYCQHTVRVDIRRVRSSRNLFHSQLIYSPNDFIVKEKLGEGFFANVKKIISKETSQEMVLKELKLSCINESTQTMCTDLDTAGAELCTPSRSDFLINYAELNAAHKSFLKEAQVLRNLSHPNVIKLIGIMFTKQKHLNLILEYISGGTLKDIIHNISNVLPWKLRVGYAKDIAAAMEYLHSLNIIHRDLKSDNCLVRENGRTVVVADFGLSRINTAASACISLATARNSDNPLRFIRRLNDSFNMSLFNRNLMSSSNSYLQSPQSSSATNSFIVAAKRKLKRHTRKPPRYAVVGNSFSMAPEMLNHQMYDERVDIFSFGIICCEIIGRVQADPDYLPRTSDFGLNVELFRKKYCEADCPKHFIRIAIACCELEPDKRPPFTKTHLWLETILSHLESNNPIPKNLLKNILDQNTKRPLSSLIS